MDFNTVMTIVNIISILLSPVVAVGIGHWLSKRNEIRQQRFNILYALMTSRVNRANMQYVNALNSIDVIFHDKENVRNAFRELKEILKREDPRADDINNANMKLIEDIANSLGYKDKITWKDITTPYVPEWFVNECKSNAQFKEIQLQLGSFMDFMQGFKPAPMQHKDKSDDTNPI